MGSGWIKLNRKILEWEHYRNANASRVFLHLLLVADYETGTAVVAIREMAARLGMSYKAARIAMEELKKSGEIKIDSATRNGTEISVVKWPEYQGRKEGRELGRNLGRTETTCFQEDSIEEGRKEGRELGRNLGRTVLNKEGKEGKEESGCEIARTREEPPQLSVIDAEDRETARFLRDAPRYPETPEEVVAMAARAGRVMTKEQAENFLGSFAACGWKTKYGTTIQDVPKFLCMWLNHVAQAEKNKEARNANFRPVSGVGRPHRFGDYSGDYSDVKSGDFRI